MTFRNPHRPGTFSRAGTVFFIAAALLSSLCGLPYAASAHSVGGNNVYTVIGKLPDSLAGMTIQVNQSIEPEVLVQNQTHHELEIVDSHGRPFLRIDADGVMADRNAPAWYESRTSLKNEPEPKGVTEDSKPDWVRISNDASYGWYDPRIATHDMKISHAVADADKAANIGHWSIPVRVDGKSASIDGVFRHIPPPSGAFQQQLTSSWHPAPNVMVDLSVGRVPGVSVTNTGKQTVTVMGIDGERFLRFTDHGVYANTASRSWAQSGRVNDSTPFVSGEKPHWQRISAGHRFTWIEPRGAYAKAKPPDGISDDKPTVLQKWQVPTRIGAKSSPIEGVTYWRPFPQTDHDAHHHDHDHH